ncbi:MAG: DUF5362 domain-containing protein [Bacteroidetes bacterium]|nr:DUF5362 domain-containing protein [Bacteroidota bacterium]
MDNQTNHSGENNLMVSGIAQAYLRETAKWTFFFAILGFIAIGFLVLFALFAGTFSSLISNDFDAVSGLSSNFGLIGSVIYILVAVLYFFPTLYLYNYSRKLKEALLRNNEMELTEAFKNQKSFYKFTGIVTIVILSIYLISFLFVIAAAASF